MRAGWMRRVAVLIAGAAVAAGTANAQDRKKSGAGEKYALLVGVRKYDPNELRPLLYTEADVTQLAVVLRERGYRPGNIVLLTQTAGVEDDRFAPRGPNVRQELALLLKGLDEADSVLVALAGHGVQFPGDSESYFCPSDARLADKSTLIPLGEVYKNLEASGAGLKVLLVDACRNDPQTDNSRARSSVNLESVTRPHRSTPGGVVAIYSCSAGEKAYEHAELKHGVFFHFVIEALKGAAVPADEREVLVPDLEKYVKRRVKDFVREKYGVLQLPERLGADRGLVPLAILDRAVVPDAPPLRPSPPLVSTAPPAPRPGETITSKLGIKLALIPAGSFEMGSPDDEPEAREEEHPRHRVTIGKPFYLGVHEVTQAEYEQVTGENPSWFSSKGGGKDRVAGLDTGRFPVETVSWEDAVAFCNKLSEREGLRPYYQFGEGARSGGDGYRLPSEAEWEYACRAGTTGAFSFGARIGPSQANFNGDHTYNGSEMGAYLKRPAPVGSYPANAFGLSDMHGNVCEWCSDYHDGEYYKNSTDLDPKGPITGTSRVLRGGAWSAFPSYLRSAYRYRYDPTDRVRSFGFRLARTYH